MEFIVTVAGILVLGVLIGFRLGSRYPDRETKESFRDEGVRVALGELTERPWICTKEIAGASIRIERDHGLSSMVVRSGGARSPKVGDQVRLEMGSPTPHHSIAVYHMKWGEIFKPVRVEKVKRADAPAKKHFDPVDSLVRSGIPG